jgi:putative tryptophan/tyrosine transport system substrate-binding protein
VARAQQPAKVPRIGFLNLAPAAAWANEVEALRAGLRDLGYVEGKNIVIEFRWADAVDQLPELATELVRMKVDVIIAPASTEVEPVRQVTKTIPIVFAQHADPVGLGHVASLARPGGNITGVSMVMTELSAKALQILKDALPQAKRIGVFWNPTTPSHTVVLKEVELAGKSLGIQLLMMPTETVADFEFPKYHETKPPGGSGSWDYRPISFQTTTEINNTTTIASHTCQCQSFGTVIRSSQRLLAQLNTSPRCDRSPHFSSV